jgi:hypothetical protein
MMFNATCNNISFILWRLVLLVEKTTDPDYYKPGLAVLGIP